MEESKKKEYDIDWEEGLVFTLPRIADWISTWIRPGNGSMPPSSSLFTGFGFIFSRDTREVVVFLGVTEYAWDVAHLFLQRFFRCGWQ